ncbi:MAG: hypothetical protein E4H01_15535 [Lysobacterales bacterium]|nr:MAG: hypothetical protein E4H01_15535 [Xanthomonadales bacterium]
MTTPITIRYQEVERYDPQIDAEVVRLMAISNIGTWHMETEQGKAGELRAKRSLFREFVESAAAKGQRPCEVHL